MGKKYLIPGAVSDSIVSPGRDRIFPVQKGKDCDARMINTDSIRSGMTKLAETLSEPGKSCFLRGVGWALSGFLLSAGALGRTFQPLAMGLLCAAPPGWGAVLMALGGMAGYPVFWGRLGLQGSAWMAFALPVALLLGDRGITRRQKTLLPAIGALIVSGTGVLFQARFGDTTPVPVFLLRVVTGVLVTGIFQQWRQCRSRRTDLAVTFVGVLALAQVVPVRYLSLGFVAAGYLAASGQFPEAALAGLALDLAQVTSVKMTAALCASFCLSRFPGMPRWMPMLASAVSYTAVSVLSGVWDVKPLPGLILGGALAGILPERHKKTPPRRTGEAAVAQVRLEQMALALRQMEASLLLVQDAPPDKEAVLAKSCAGACDACPERRGCKARALLPGMGVEILEQPGLSEEDLPAGCRKQGRLLTELRRGQEQLRRMKGDRNRLEGYRCASREQYGYLADFLERVSDDLARRNEYRAPRFRPDIGLCTRGSKPENGDKCLWFEGRGNCFYVLLCDGMGTGSEAAKESAEAARLLKQMLVAGFPAEYALRSLNSLAILREFGGCSTVDLAEIHLDTGKGTVYKWGAAPSYLMTSGQLRKIGTASPPPGLLHSCREVTDRLSLGRGERLILLSDGVSEEGLLDSARTTPTQPPGEMAAAILEKERSGGDDATAVVIRLLPGCLSAS